MKKLLLYILLLNILTIARCSNMEQEDKILVIDNIKTNEHQRFPGTRTFITPPEGFNLIKQFSRFSKVDGTSFIMTYETKDTPYNPNNFTIISLDSMKEKVIERTKVKLQEYDGVLILLETVEDTTNRKIILVFGDNSFSSTVFGVYPKNDNYLKEKILNSLKTAYYDKSFNLDELELANFDIDLSSSNFKLNQTMTNIFAFTPNGKGDAFRGVAQTKIVIQQLQYLGDSLATKNYGLNMVENYKMAGMEILSINSKGKFIQDNYAYESIIKAQYQGKPNVIYQLILTGKKSTILFSGNAYEDGEIYLKTFQTIAGTLSEK